jgi:hypothetical protein
MSVDDDARSVRPSAVTCVKEQIDQHIRDNRRIRNDGTATEIYISRAISSARMTQRSKENIQFSGNQET